MIQLLAVEFSLLVLYVLYVLWSGRTWKRELALNVLPWINKGERKKEHSVSLYVPYTVYSFFVLIHFNRHCFYECIVWSTMDCWVSFFAVWASIMSQIYHVCVIGDRSTHAIAYLSLFIFLFILNVIQCFRETLHFSLF